MTNKCLNVNKGKKNPQLFRRCEYTMRFDIQNGIKLAKYNGPESSSAFPSQIGVGVEPKEGISRRDAAGNRSSPTSAGRVRRPNPQGVQFGAGNPTAGTVLPAPASCRRGWQSIHRANGGGASLGGNITLISYIEGYLGSFRG